jgi:hypothetical protein
MTIIKNFVAPALPIPSREYKSVEHIDVIRALRLYFNQLDNYLGVVSVPPSGPTTDRPIANLAVGEYYFDTTLGIPIWYDGSGWVDATGSSV